MGKTARIGTSLIVALGLIFGVSAPAFAMQIFATMPGGTIVTLDVESSDTVENVKTKIQDKEGVPPDRMYLVYQSTLLEDGHTLSDYGISSLASLQVFYVATYVRWLGGTPAFVCGQYFDHRVTSDASGNQFGLVGGALPAGLTLNGVNGRITGTPTTAGPFSFTIRTNNDGSTAQHTFRGSVECIPNTGATDSAPLLVTGAALLIAGAALVLVRARRRAL